MGASPLDQDRWWGLPWCAAACCLVAACSHSSPSAGDCGGHCGSGLGCIDGVCRVLCVQDHDCPSGFLCREGACYPETGECAESHSCTTPGTCQTVRSAVCVEGTCRYEYAASGIACDDGDRCTVADACDGVGGCAGVAVTCAQPPDTNVCRALTGSCDPGQSAGTCQGTACCVFAPVWPTGSPAPQPACPIGGEDADGDGVEDGSESWSGACDHDGRCIACVTDGDCGTGNCECGDAQCDSTRCSAVDCDCRFNAANDSACDGPLADGRDDHEDSCGATNSCDGTGRCHLPDGLGCATAQQCLSHQCVLDTCCSTACPKPWLTGFGYRRPVLVSSSSALSDFQVVVVTATEPLVAAGKLRSDCGDMQWTAPDQLTPIPFWIESGCNTGTTRVWVKVPTLVAGNQTIYFYYGKADAWGSSSVAATFIREVGDVVASWSFNEGSGGAAADGSGSGHTLNLTSTAWATNDCRFDGCLSLNGTTSYGTIPVAAGWGFNQQLTVEAWMKRADLNGCWVVTRWLESEDSFALKYRGDNGDHYVGFMLSLNGTGSNAEVTGTTLLEQYVWHHLVGVFDGSARTLSAYADGVMDVSTATTQSTFHPINRDAELGRLHGYSGTECAGLIDDVRIYSRALTSAEVRDLHDNQGYTTPSYPGKVLVHKWAAPAPATGVGPEETP